MPHPMRNRTIDDGSLPFAATNAMMLTPRQLGKQVAKQRRRAHLTQAEVAIHLGVERATISRIEQGRQTVDTVQLSAIATALGSCQGITCANE